MKRIRRFNKFNEALTKDELESMDLEEISWSIGDWWIPVSEALPTTEKPLLVFTVTGVILITTFEKGISKAEREALKEKDPNSERWRLVKFGDEDGNNLKPWRWKIYEPHRAGHGSIFGHEVTHWMPLPAKPN
jgi:hypothetical protein